MALISQVSVSDAIITDIQHAEPLFTRKHVI